MAVHMLCNDTVILHIKNSIMYSIFESIEDIVEQKNYTINNNLNDIITQLYVAGHGIGFDIAEYLKNKEDALTFADLVLQAINYKQDTQPYSPEARALLLHFHHEILKYAQTL